MMWILSAYLLGLLYFSANQDKITDLVTFRNAWLFFIGVPSSHAFFTLFRASSADSMHSLALVEIWSSGIAWFFLAMSLYFLINSLVPEDSVHSGQTKPLDSESKSQMKE